MLKPKLYLTKDYPTFTIFCNEFNRIYWEIQRKENIDSPELGPSDEDCILSMMFLHIILECLITYCTRHVVDQFVKKHLRDEWQRLEKGMLAQKIKFITSCLDRSDADLIVMGIFATKSSNNRNLIVHGHDLSVTYGPNLYQPSLYQKVVNDFDSVEYIGEFKICIQCFFKVIRKIALIHCKADGNFEQVISSIERQFKNSFLTKQ